MPVDKFGRSPKKGQNVTNVAGVSHELCDKTAY